MVQEFSQIYKKAVPL